MQATNRLVIGITGASGSILGIELLKAVKALPDLESHLVLTKAGKSTLKQESEYSVEEVCALADKLYDIDDIGESIASGTYKTAGMVVVPCSMKTLAGISSGYSDNLLLRAADVTLKERRLLVLVARETPLSSIHLRNMLSLSQLGAVILPPLLSFYGKPLSIETMTKNVVGKILDLFGYELPGFIRWGERIDDQSIMC